MPAIIVTLGTLAIYRSWLIDHADAKTITADSLPSWVVDLPDAGRSSASVTSTCGWCSPIVVAVVVVLQLALARLRWGRRLYADRLEPRGRARSPASRPQRLVLGAFVGCGALSGLAGFLFLARFGTITVVAGQGLELDSVAAAVVGGVSILGGVGHPRRRGARRRAHRPPRPEPRAGRARSASSGATPSSAR